MTRRTGQNGIVAIACVALCLVVKVSGAADAKRENDGDDLSSLRKAVLTRFDINHNGRLDSKEKAKAYRELTSRDDSDDGLNTLRDQLLARFDKNGNGKLERSEVRTALTKLKLKPQVAGAGQLSASTTPTEIFSDRNRAAAAIAKDPTAAVALAAQQLTMSGVDSATAQALAIERFDLNGDGILDQAELALAQSAALRELSALASSNGTFTSLPLATTLSTGTTTTGTTSTGTTSTGTSASGMSGGCSGTGSGSGSGSSGTPGSSGSSITTNSAAQPTNNQNNQGFGSPSFANFGGRGFGGGRGR